MNNKDNKNFAYEDRVQFFTEAMREELRKEYGEPRPLDKSFMNENMPPAKPSRKRRFSIVAVAAVAVLCITLVAIPIVDGGQVYGDKGILHRLYESVMGIGTDEHDGKDKERVSTVEITDMKNIEEAKDLCNDLYVPEYVPEGFILEKLTVTKTVDTGVEANYIFNKGSETFSIEMVFMEGSYNSNMKGEVIKMKDRTINSIEGQGVQMFTEESISTIFGDLSQAEAIRIAKELQK